MVNKTFISPTKLAVEMRIKAEMKRNPIFETADVEVKNRILAMTEPVYKMLSELEGCPQEVVDEILKSEEFWAAMSCSMKVSNTAKTGDVMKATRNIITDLCA